MRNLIRNELSWTLDFLFLCISRNSSAPISIGRQVLAMTMTVVVPFLHVDEA